MNKVYSFDFFSSRGVSADFADAFEEYASKLEEKKLPVIFDFEHLALLLGVSNEFLAKMVFAPEKFYRSFKMNKRAGGYRLISVPHSSLKCIQRWILENILYKQNTHSGAHGFVKGKSIKTNAASHLSGSVLYQVDIKDFFPTIKINWVINFFRRNGYTPEVAFYLASLMCLDNKLAQGAPTSPAMANLICVRLDERLRRLSAKHNITYTRYADDMTFSGEYISLEYQSWVKKIIEDEGFLLNNNKTRLKIVGGNRVITGLVVDKGELSIPREYKRKISQEIFFIQKYGYLSHIKKKGIKDPNYIYKLLGKISFWMNIEKNNKKACTAFLLLKKIMME